VCFKIRIRGHRDRCGSVPEVETRPVGRRPNHDERFDARLAELGRYAAELGDISAAEGTVKSAHEREEQRLTAILRE
jgi:hypothetical protein